MLNQHVASPSYGQNPNEIIDTMIDLRIQLFHLKQQIDQLQADFTAACLALNIEKLALERAIITRKFTPGQWLFEINPKMTDNLLFDNRVPEKPTPYCQIDVGASRNFEEL